VGRFAYTVPGRKAVFRVSGGDDGWNFIGQFARLRRDSEDFGTEDDTNCFATGGSGRPKKRRCTESTPAGWAPGFGFAKAAIGSGS